MAPHIASEPLRGEALPFRGQANCVGWGQLLYGTSLHTRRWPTALPMPASTCVPSTPSTESPGLKTGSRPSRVRARVTGLRVGVCSDGASPASLYIVQSNPPCAQLPYSNANAPNMAGAGSCAEHDFMGWLSREASWDKLKPQIDAAVAKLKEGGASKFGCIGFCWGVSIAMQAGQVGVMRVKATCMGESRRQGEMCARAAARHAMSLCCFKALSNQHACTKLCRWSLPESLRLLSNAVAPLLPPPLTLLANRRRICTAPLAQDGHTFSGVGGAHPALFGHDADFAEKVQCPVVLLPAQVGGL